MFNILPYKEANLQWIAIYKKTSSENDDTKMTIIRPSLSMLNNMRLTVQTKGEKQWTKSAVQKYIPRRYIGNVSELCKYCKI